MEKETKEFRILVFIYIYLFKHSISFHKLKFVIKPY